MTSPSQTLSLKSETVGLLLIAFLWLGLAFSASSLLFSLLELFAPDIYISVEVLDIINSIAELPISLTAVILFLVWMYLLHRDLKTLFRTYPITPRQSLAQLMIPFYNIWGIWNVFATLADRLKTTGGATLRFWLPLLYVTGFASRTLTRLVAKGAGDGESQASPTLLVTAFGVDLLLSIVWLEMARVIRKAVRHRAREIEDEKASAAKPA